MTSVFDEWSEMRGDLEEDVTNSLDYGIGFLAFIERFPEFDIHREDFVDIPKHLLNKVRSAGFRDDI